MMNQSVTQKMERMQLRLKWNLESTSTLKIVFDTCLLSWPYRYKRPTRSTGAPATYFHVCSSCSLCFQADEELYPHGQTEKNHCWAPEATDARSDQAEFCGRGGGKWSAATFSFCFARWCQAGTVLEIPPAPLPSWPPQRQFSYISWKLKKNKKNKEPLWSSVVNKPHHVCCAPRVDIMSCSGSDLTTEHGTRTQVQKNKKTKSNVSRA